MSRILKNKEILITQKFNKGKHNGLDIVGEGSTLDTVTSHSSGEVVWIQTEKVNNNNVTGDETYGNAVKIKHPNGYYTLYAHLKDVYVKVGDKVKTKQDIGYMGNTGRSYGAHLHFEVRTNSSYSSCVNPEVYLNTSFDNNSSNKYINNSLVGSWQKVMNESYNTKLAIDNSFGPLSQKEASKHELFWKKNQIKNSYVKWVQNKLNLLGFKGKDNKKLKEDSYFGENTDYAVRNYQKARKILDNGIVGKYTVEWFLKDRY